MASQAFAGRRLKTFRTLIGLLAIWIYALYVFSPVTGGKKFKFPFPGLSGQIDPAMAGAERRPPRHGKKWRRSVPGEGAIFFPSVVGSGRLVFLPTLSVKVLFCTRYRLRAGKKFVFAHVIGYGRGKSSRHPAAAPQKRNCVFSQLRTGKKFDFAHVIGYGREKQRARLVFFWRSFLPARARPPSSQIGPKKFPTGKGSARKRSFSRPCWCTLFLLLLWKYVKGVSPYGAKAEQSPNRSPSRDASEFELRRGQGPKVECES